MSHHLERTHVEHAVVAILVLGDRYQLKAYSIVQASLVDNIAHGILLTSFSAIQYRVVLRHYVDSIPALCHSLFPLCNILCQAVVISLQLVETSCLLGIELVIVVVELTLHRIVRSDGSDRVLDCLHPTFAVTLFVAIV